MKTFIRPDLPTRRLQLEQQDLANKLERQENTDGFDAEAAQDAVAEALLAGNANSDDIEAVYVDSSDEIKLNLKDTVISSKPSAGTLDGTEEVLVDDGGVLKKTTTQDIADFATANFTQSTTTKTTGSLANNAEETGIVAMGKTAIIIKVSADRACRVRLYISATDRTADLGRAIGIDVVDGNGNLIDERPCLEVVIKATRLTERLRPPHWVYNADAPRTSDIYYAIQNRSGSTSTVEVEFTKLTLEA